MFGDLSVKVRHEEISCAIDRARELGFSCVALDQVMETSDSKGSHISHFPQPLCIEDREGIQVIKRLTIDLRQCDKYHNNLMHILSKPDLSSSFQLIAIRPHFEKHLLSLLNCNSVFDILCLDHNYDMLALLKPEVFRILAQKNISIEISYSDLLRDAVSRASILEVSNKLVKISRKRHQFVLSSGATVISHLKSPTDTMSLATLLGFSEKSGKVAISNNVTKCLEHARGRRDNSHMFSVVRIDESIRSSWRFNHPTRKRIMRLTDRTALSDEGDSEEDIELPPDDLPGQPTTLPTSPRQAIHTLIKGTEKTSPVKDRKAKKEATLARKLKKAAAE